MAMKTITFYAGTANKTELTLKANGSVVGDDLLTRAMLKFGPYCLDTAEAGHADMFAFTDNATKLSVKAGLLDGIQAGTYVGMLTLFDAASGTDGLAWEQFPVVIKPWSKCPAA